MDKVLTHVAASAAEKCVVQKSLESRDKFVENLSLSILDRCGSSSSSSETADVCVV